MGYLILTGLTIVAFVVLLDRHSHRAWRERENDRQERARLTNLTDQQATAHRAELQTLLQRIQAPDVAVVQHQQADATDDKSYPLNEQEQAEAQDALRVAVAQIEAMEREGVGFLGDE